MTSYAAAVAIDASAFVSADARITESSRGTKIVVGARSRIEAFVIVRCVGGTGDIVIGRDCYINEHCVLYSGSGITIGDDVLLAPGVSIVPANHDFSRRDIPIRQQGFRPSKGGVVVGSGAWIGARAVLLDGARVGEGAIVAAGSVVSGEIPANEIWAGIPAAYTRTRP